MVPLPTATTFSGVLKLLSKSVKGLTVWDPALFRVRLVVPALSVPEAKLSRAKKVLKPHLLKLARVQHIVDDEDTKGNRWLLLNPDLVTSVEDLPSESLGSLLNPFPTDPLPTKTLDLGADNFRPGQLLDAVLEEAEPGVPSLSSYAVIGHVVHLNLKEYHLPYKKVIGEILLLGLAHASVVVNKTDTIDNTFRNFAMEVLAKEGDEEVSYEVEVKENGCRFRFDFSSVYWNPRLCTEHSRLVSLLSPSDWLLDVFAGVGPFAVPAAKKCARVVANDLNPHSARACEANLKLNKKGIKDAVVVNKDGREFIRSDVKGALLDPKCEGAVHVAMNLPALAVEFVDAFRGLLSEEEKPLRLPRVHVYAFSKEEDGKGDVRSRVEASLGAELGSCEVSFVRNVAPNKDMFRASFTVSEGVLRSKRRKSQNEAEEASEAKKSKSE